MNDKLKVVEPLREEKPLSEIDRAIIGGNSVRLDIPLTDIWSIRNVPDLLRGYASYIEFKLQQDGLEDRSKLSEIANEGRAVRLRIRELAGASKFNKNGTVKK